MKSLRTRTRAITVILITGERLLRADLKPGTKGVIKGLYQRLRPDTDDPVSLVDAAIRLSRKSPGRVVVFSTDVWTQTLRMLADATRGLSDGELSRSLGFEAEPLSGIAAFDSTVAYTALRSDSEHREFWLVQTPSSQLAQIDDVVNRSGGQLIGLGHPAGIANHWASQPAGERWQHVELWPGAIVCLRGGGSSSPQVHVINADPGQRTWQAKVEQWRAAEPGAGELQWLVPEAGAQAPSGGEAVISLADDGALRQWLAAAAQQLCTSMPGVPLVRPAVRPMSKQKRMALTGALTAAALAGCGGHYLYTERTIADLGAQNQVIRGEINHFTALKKQVTDLAAKRDKAQAELDKLAQKVRLCDDTLAAHQLRWKKLLELLAEQRPEHLVVQKIDSLGDKLSISGLCLGSHPANALASGLGLRLRELGWEVQPARQQAGDALIGGEPWEFELVLRDAELVGDLAASTNPAGPDGPPQLVPREPVNKVASFRGPGGATSEKASER